MSREIRDHAEIWSGATGSSTSMNNATERRAMDLRSKCHGTAAAGLSCMQLLGEHRGVEAGGRKGRGSDDESKGA
ncbi:hypothetical protein GW17_00034477 [Ensete ventricosum]|nr:hypothetical protein GW17_00034477 [Ensete ventricosum]